MVFAGDGFPFSLVCWLSKSFPLSLCWLFYEWLNMVSVTMPLSLSPSGDFQKNKACPLSQRVPHFLNTEYTQCIYFCSVGDLTYSWRPSTIRHKQLSSTLSLNYFQFYFYPRIVCLSACLCITMHMVPIENKQVSGPLALEIQTIGSYSVQLVPARVLSAFRHEAISLPLTFIILASTTAFYPDRNLHSTIQLC